jgi:Protein of unknwon function (DUF3310)
MSDALKKQVDGQHYKDMGIQPWEIIQKNKLDYFEGAALKYLLRWRHKDGLIDLDKIIHYVERIKEMAMAGHYGEKFIKVKIESDIDFKSPIQNWPFFTESWKDLPDKEKYQLIDQSIKAHFKRLADARNKPLETRSIKKRTKVSIKRKKA